MNAHPEQPAEHRLAEALCSPNPADELWKLSLTFKAEGLTQSMIQQLFDEFRSKHENDEDERKLNAILDTMDYIRGFCSPKMRLFP